MLDWFEEKVIVYSRQGYIQWIIFELLIDELLMELRRMLFNDVTHIENFHPNA